MNGDQAIQEEIAAARALFAAQAEALLAERELAGLLAAYRAEIAESWAVMDSLGVVGRCVTCAGQHPGGCCFPGADRWQDRLSLLINLLLGVELPADRQLPGACFFVGPEGCRLKARDAFCLNYYCPEQITVLGPERLRRVWSQAGREVAVGLALEQALLAWLAARV